jgi:hypothetical protein
MPAAGRVLLAKGSAVLLASQSQLLIVRTKRNCLFLNRAGEAVKQATDGQEADAAGANAVENLSGFSKTKRDLAIKLGVDPYTTNEVFQKELNKVAWPAFLGKFTVDLGMAAVGGVALSAVNWTSTLTDALRDKSPAELRLMNLGLLTDNMGVARWDADAFLNNNTISQFSGIMQPGHRLPSISSTRSRAGNSPPRFLATP